LDAIPFQAEKLVALWNSRGGTQGAAVLRQSRLLIRRLACQCKSENVLLKPIASLALAIARDEAKAVFRAAWERQSPLSDGT